MKMDDTMTIQSKIKELRQNNVVIKNEENLEKKLKNIVADGAGRLQVIADFDYTLTKSEIDGKPTYHSFDILTRVKTLSQAYHDESAVLEKKYAPQVDKVDTAADKTEILRQWWEDHEKLMIGEEVTLPHLQEATDSANTPLRDGFEHMVSLLAKHEVPLVVVSAGIGDIIKRSLENFKLNIVSNFFNISEDGKVNGFVLPWVGIYNKHKIPFPVEDSRQNVILLGDSLGDSKMADGLEVKTILKIAFFNGEDNKDVEKYKDTFDIVLMNDQTMDTVNALLRQILTAS